MGYYLRLDGDENDRLLLVKGRDILMGRNSMNKSDIVAHLTPMSYTLATWLGFFLRFEFGPSLEKQWILASSCARRYFQGPRPRL